MKIKVEQGKKLKVKIDWSKKSYIHKSDECEINLPWPEFKARKIKKPGSILNVTDIVEPGVEFWEYNSKKWEKVPENGIVIGSTVGHVKFLDPKTEYRYPKDFKEDSAFWKKMLPNGSKDYE